jgi:hypothetical protein
LEFPHNGIVCKNCYRTIDLTDLADGGRGVGGIEGKKPITDAFATPEGLYIRCPYCTASKDYNYNQIKPLFDAHSIEARLTTLESRFTDKHFLSDLAETIIKQVEEKQKAAQSNAKPEDSKNPLAS